MSGRVFTSEDREGLVLGTILVNPDNLYEVVLALKGNGVEFTRSDYRQIFYTIMALTKQGKGIDVWNIVEELKKQNVNIGGDNGRALCFELAKNCPFTKGIARPNATWLREQYIRRSVSAKLVVLAEDCKNGNDIDDIRNGLLDTLLITHDQSGKTEEAYEDIRQEMESRITERWDSVGKGLPASGITSGIKIYDDLTGGLHRRELIVVGARPGIGKTMLMVHIGLGTAKNGNKTGLWSLEMDRLSISERLVVNHADLNGSRVRTGQFRYPDQREEYEEKIKEAGDEIGSLPFWIYDQNGTIDEVIASMFVAAKKRSIDVFLVDYLQRIAPSINEKKLRRNEQVENAARRFKEFAKETDTAVVLFSQLNRGTEINVGKKPEIENLRDSGGIEQEADVIILLHRDKSKDDATEMEMDVAKNRHGPTSGFKLTFDPGHAKFTECY